MSQHNIILTTIRFMFKVQTAYYSLWFAYVQITNPDINRIGCGAAQCPAVSGLPILTNAVVLVCNYATETQSESDKTERAEELDVSSQISTGDYK